MEKARHLIASGFLVNIHTHTHTHSHSRTHAYIFMYVDASGRKTGEEQSSSAFTALTVCVNENSCVMISIYDCSSICNTSIFSRPKLLYILTI